MAAALKRTLRYERSVGTVRTVSNHGSHSSSDVGEDVPMAVKIPDLIRVDGALIP